MALTEYSTLSGNARVAAVLAQEIVLKLADRASLHNHPSLINFGNRMKLLAEKSLIFYGTSYEFTKH